MNIFKKFVLSAKVERGTINLNEFQAICEAFICGEKYAERMLKQYFSLFSPDHGMLNYIYSRRSDDLFKIYYENMKDRQLSMEEQLMLVRVMPLPEYFRFPHPLSEVALSEMFGIRKHDVGRMERYIGSYALPEKYEVKLIDLCKDCKAPYDLNVYAQMLKKYIISCKEPIFEGEKALDALVSYNEPVIRELIAGFCNIEDVFLPEETIRIMIEDGNMSALRTLLYNSRVHSNELRDLIVEKFPYLKTAVEISEIRYRLYKEEKSLGIFCGVSTLSTQERSFMDIRDDLGDNFEEVLSQKMNEPETTTCLLVWAAYQYPSMETKAVKRLRTMSLR